MSTDDEIKKTQRIALAAAKRIADRPGVAGVIVLVSINGADGTTNFVREQQGSLHAVEGILREKIRELEHYEQGYHLERGRYDALTHRQRRQERERNRRQGGEG